MKKRFLALALATVTAGSLFAQKMTTTSAMISFDATTEKDALPKAETTTAVASFDSKTGAIAFEAVMKDFSFTNPMIQEHFNGEKWLNSDKYPKATFKGTITNISDVHVDKDGSYTANVEGNLSLHGETKPVKTTAQIVVASKKIHATSEFSISLADYKVEGGAIAAGKVATDPKISVVADFK